MKLRFPVTEIARMRYVPDCDVGTFADLERAAIAIETKR
jgi:hypothetical protein